MGSLAVKLPTRPAPICGCCGGPRSIYSAAWCKDCYSVKTRPTQFKPVHSPGINYEQLAIVLAEIAAREERDARREELRQQRIEARRQKLERRLQAYAEADARRVACTEARLAVRALRAAETAAWRAQRQALVARTKAERAAVKARRAMSSPATLSYPYVRTVDNQHSDLMLVNSIVPRAMEGREDVCQEIMIALWEKRISIADVRAKKDSIREFITMFRRNNFESGGYAISLDEPLRDGRSWHDILVDPSSHQDGDSDASV